MKTINLNKSLETRMQGCTSIYRQILTVLGGPVWLFGPVGLSDLRLGSFSTATF